MVFLKTLKILSPGDESPGYYQPLQKPRGEPPGHLSSIRQSSGLGEVGPYSRFFPVLLLARGFRPGGI
jgi:hypothetical protein